MGAINGLLRGGFRMAGMVKRTVLVLVCMVAVLGTAACHTVRGVGQDTQAAGRAIDRAAQ